MNTAWMNSLKFKWLGYGILTLFLILTLGCAKEQPVASDQVTDQASAERYYKQFFWKRPIPVPGVGGPGSYLQSPAIPADENKRKGLYKLNLFLDENNKFILEYSEVLNDGKPENQQGEFHGTIFAGDWFVKDTALILDNNKVGELRAKKTDEGNPGVELYLKAVPKAQNGNINFTPKSPIVLVKKASTRILPDDLLRGLEKEMVDTEKSGKPQSLK